MPPVLSQPCPPYTRLGLPESATWFYATRVINGIVALHAAVDLARDEQGRPMPEGADLISPMPDGSVVRQAGWGDGNTGNLVTLYKDGFESRSLHNRDVVVAPGQTVNRGQLLGHCGQTGLANGVHSHWAVWADTKALALQVQSDPVPAYGKWAVNPLLMLGEDDFMAALTDDEQRELLINSRILIKASGAGVDYTDSKPRWDNRVLGFPNDVPFNPTLLEAFRKIVREEIDKPKP